VTGKVIRFRPQAPAGKDFEPKEEISWIPAFDCAYHNSGRGVSFEGFLNFS